MNNSIILRAIEKMINVLSHSFDDLRQNKYTSKPEKVQKVLPSQVKTANLKKLNLEKQK